jgi:hypothetical protein
VQRALADRGRALPSVPGFTGATFIGAAQTSSHGSGLGAGPLGDLVRAYELVDGLGRLRAVQHPADRVLEAAGHRGDILTDAGVFGALGVGLGLLGAIARVWIEPPAEVWLHESRWLSTWDAARRRMAAGEPFTHVAESYLLNPYARAGGQRTCSISTHDPLRGPRMHRRRPRSETLPRLLRQGARMAALLPRFAITPHAIPNLIEASFATFAADRELEGPNGSLLGHDFYGLAPRGYGLELSVPYGPRSCSRAVSFIDALLEAIGALQRSHRYVGGFMSVRFSRRWDAPLSLTHGESACHVELIALAGTWRGRETLLELGAHLRSWAPRHHLGLLHAASADDLAAAYPELEVVRRARRLLDPTGRFANGLSDRLRL